MRFARIDPVTNAVALIDIDQSIYQAFVDAGNPKAAYLRPLVVDTQPVPSATQVIQLGPIIIEPAQARQTWLLSNKPAGQIAGEVQSAELAQLMAIITSLQNGNGTAVERLARVERACVWLLKGQM